MVSEGLAENFATYLYGEDKAGPWVTETDMETLNEYIKANYSRWIECART